MSTSSRHRDEWRVGTHFFLQCLLFHALAQPCWASVVNGDFSAGNSGFTTGYAFIASGTSTTPGTYGVRASSQGFNPSYVVFGDHTTGSGQMMLIDGSPVANVTVWSELLSVTPNTVYSWSAWAASADQFNPANLTFSINGTQVGANMALTTNAGQWQLFTTTWNSGISTTANLEILDTDTTSFGNDFALDDISFEIVPEPDSIFLAFIGVGLVGFFRRR